MTSERAAGPAARGNYDLRPQLRGVWSIAGAGNVRAGEWGVPPRFRFSGFPPWGMPHRPEASQAGPLPWRGPTPAKGRSQQHKPRSGAPARNVGSAGQAVNRGLHSKRAADACGFLMAEHPWACAGPSVQPPGWRSCQPTQGFSLIPRQMLADLPRHGRPATRFAFPAW